MMIASILSQAGYQVGRFISPHLHSYCERLSIDGIPIDGKLFLAYLNDLEKKVQSMLAEGCQHPTEFEILTAVAFQYFKDKQVDIAVLEAGLGGIYDSTNVIIPEVSVITGVDYDHLNFLGTSLEEIAYNKAGIIKNQVPVVTGEMEERAINVIRHKAWQQNAELHPSTEVEVIRLKKPDIDGQLVDIKSAFFNLKQVKFSLLGDYQLKNLATALTSLAVLKQQHYQLKERDIEITLASMKMPGRLEVIKRKLPVIIDVAHNPQAAASLEVSLDNLFPAQKRVMVCGLVDDKDASNIIIHWGKNTRACVVTRPEGERGGNWRRVTEEWKRAFPHTLLYEEESIIEAVKKGQELVQGEEYLLITGSFYVLNQARSYLINT